MRRAWGVSGHHVPAHLPQLTGFIGNASWSATALMRHCDVLTTMNVYGDAATPELAEARAKIVGFALNGLQARLNR